jgi:hypothetical protein
MPKQETLMEALRAAWLVHGEYVSRVLMPELMTWWQGPIVHVPGMGTNARLALRLHNGKTPEEALAAEYLYRWHLAVKPFDQCEGATRNPAVSIFGAPHTIGM